MLFDVFFCCKLINLTVDFNFKGSNEVFELKNWKKKFCLKNLSERNIFFKTQKIFFFLKYYFRTLQQQKLLKLDWRHNILTGERPVGVPNALDTTFTC